MYIMTSHHSRKRMHYKPKPKGKKTGGAFMDAAGSGVYSNGSFSSQMAQLDAGHQTLAVKPVPCMTGGKDKKKTQRKRSNHSKHNRKSRRH